MLVTPPVMPLSNCKRTSEPPQRALLSLLGTMAMLQMYSDAIVKMQTNDAVKKCTNDGASLERVLSLLDVVATLQMCLSLRIAG